MNSKIVTLLALLAVVFGSAAASGIQLSVFPASNQWWIAVDPLNESGVTSKIEIAEANGAWTAMTADMGWGYFTYQTSNGNGFAFPLSFRLTDASGNQVVVNSAIASVSAITKAVDAGVSYGGSVGETAPATPNCGTNPTQAPPTTKPTSAPVTQAPTTKPTTKPSSSGHGSSSSGKSTSAPVTQAPTTKPTTKPTAKPTSAPVTQAPTTKPTSAPSSSSSGSSSGSSTDLCAVPSTSSEPLKILVPLYVSPGSAWDQLIAAAATGVKIIAIINPNSGPGSGADSSYKTYMQKLANAGIDMVGYVHTSYGERSISTVQSEINTYATKFTGLKGIFIDEASAEKSDIPYYQQVYNAITSQSGFSNVILNPGTQPDQGYLAVSTNIVIFESPASSLKSSYATWVKCAPNASQKAGYKYKFSGIAYGASQSTMASTITTMKNAGMGMVYATDGASGCCTYNTLPSYFGAMAAAVKAANN